jgi:antitoxin component HigA of HigAB toxin-antitoxin module
MDIRPIRTEEDYEAALAEIERLFDAAPFTPEGDRLDVLTTLVEVYEAQHYPIPEPDPSGCVGTAVADRRGAGDLLSGSLNGPMSEA